MADKINKIREWVSYKQDSLMDEDGYFEYPEDRGAYNVLSELVDYIDSLEEEPVSEDLEEAALLHYPKMSRISEPHDVIPADNQSHYLGDANEDNRRAFKEGAKWQKEQMIVKAVETTFNVSLSSGLYDKFWIKGCKEGDKLLVIKKDEL